MNLPPPFPYLIDNEPMAWRYPFHLMRPGEAVFVTDAHGLSIQAERALATYVRYLWDCHGLSHRDLFSVRRREVERGVRGTVISRWGVA